MPIGTSTCPICDSDLIRPSEPRNGNGHVKYACPRCGDYDLTGTADVTVNAVKEEHNESVPYVPHAIRRISKGNERPFFSSNDVKALFQSPPRPTLREQADNFIQHLGVSNTELVTIEEAGGEVSLDLIF